MKAKKGKKFSLMVAALICAVLSATGAPINASASTTITVPDDYSTIQMAIDYAASGDTVYVRAGTYYENLTIDKSLTLQGEDRETTIIDGGGLKMAVYISASNTVISGFKVTNGIWGVDLINDSAIHHVTIQDLIVTSNGEYGIRMGRSNPNGAYHIVENCIISNHSIYGISCHWSSNTTIQNCELFDHPYYAINIRYSSDALISNNEIHHNLGAMYINGMTNTIIEQNNIYSNTGTAMQLSTGANNNIIRNNIVRNNLQGINMKYASVSGNKIYHNDLIDNTDWQAGDASGINMWDDGYPSGGNYWSDYAGQDLYSGTNQDQPGSDGIGDTPYFFDFNQDNYPLFGPYANQPPSVTLVHGSVEVNEGQEANNAGTISDPDGDYVTLTASVGEIINNDDGSWSWSFPTTDGPAECQTVTITADDGNGGTATVNFDLTVNNVAPTIDSVNVPLEPTQLGTEVAVSTDFSDPAGTSDEPYPCTVNYGDNTGDQSGTVADFTCTGPGHTYASPGVYKVSVTVTDKDGDSGSGEAVEYIVIYDPDGGFVTGGGWIWSPEGACQYDACTYDTTGKASFGFVSKYKQNETVPTGQTEFQFKAGNLNFHSDTYEWLVVAGAKAMYKGEGTINNEGGYGFILKATDAEQTPSTDVDLFRIKIWDKNNKDAVVYDNEMGEEDDADPMTTIGGGNIKVHKNN